MTINTVMQYINLALNYPALAYEDINLYFDMAISELNTTLHTSIPSVSQMVEDFRQKLSKDIDARIRISSNPEISDYTIKAYATAEQGLVSAPTQNIEYFYAADTRKFYLKNQFSSGYSEHSSLKAVYFENGENPIFYVATVDMSDVFWVKESVDSLLECDLGNYLPDDWIMLWLIPYVCYKYTVRDGGTATVFADELTQGFQQLQESYNVPDKVNLATYADKEAYTKLVEENLPNLNIKIPTRAIYDSMKHARIMNAVYGNMYDRGGFDD